MRKELKISLIKTSQNSYFSKKRKEITPPKFIFDYLLVVLFLSLFFLPSKIIAENIEPDSPLEADEVLVLLYVKNLGTYEIPAAIRGKDAYLPVVDVFNFLKIRAIPGNGFDVISGFFIDPQNTYIIDRANNLIIYKGKTYFLSPSDFIVSETNLYLKPKYFDQIFGLECKFNFRTLTISLKSELELPAIRELRLEQMHSNFDRLRGKMKADTNIARKYPLFHFGMADWAVSANQQVNGVKNTRFNLGLGAIFAGGELNSLLLFNSNQPFLEQQQYYLWRYANNDNKSLRQIMVGKIAAQSVSSIFNPVLGIQITNSPTINRKSFGTYKLSNYTKPNWTVELYVNGILIDYAKADASGFFTFDVPLIYGSTDVTMRYYGPWGEELTSKQSFSIPFNFLPPKELEYKISSGFIQDFKNSLFGQARLNYGLTRAVTIGGGLEYNTSIPTTKNIAFFNTSIRLASNMLFNGEYIYGVRYKGLLSYNLPSNLQMEFYYSKYTPGQQAIRLNYSEERRLMVSKPFHFISVSALSRLTLSQNLIQNPNADFPPTKFTIPEFSLSGASHGISLNITTAAFILNKITSSIFSDASLSTALPGGILFTPQIRFDYKHNKISMVKYTLEKRFVKYGVINASYQNNLLTNAPVYQIGFRYDFPHARVGFSAMQSNSINSLSEFASGSLIYQPQINYSDFNVNTNVGRGGLIFIPFLDVNNNGKKDANEQKVVGLNVIISGGGVQKNSKDTTIAISGLEPYTDYFVEVDANSFENIGWKIKKPKMNIAIEPNKLKLIEIPISVVGEASGTVYIKKTNEEKGLGRIVVCFYNNDSVLINKTLTESDGYFSFLGLLPGNCYAKIDSDQLNKLQMTSSPSSISFTIKSSIDGDVIDGLKFTLQPKLKGTTKSVTEKQLVSKTDSLSVLVENKTILEQQALKIVSPPQISDTLIGVAILMDKQLADSIQLADKSLEIKKGASPQIPDKLNQIQELMVKKQADSIKQANKQTEIQISENPVLNVKDNFAVQARAHIQLLDAKATQTKLSKIFKQPIVIVNEGGLYKVRISGINNREEALSIIPKLDAQGFEGAFIINPASNTGSLNPIGKQVVNTSKQVSETKEQNIKDVSVNKNDFTKETPATTSENKEIKEKGIYVVQARAHSKLSDAKATQSKLSAIYKQRVIIVNEGGLYKVRISGFNNRNEALTVIPELDAQGFAGAFIINPTQSNESMKSSGKQPYDPSLDLLVEILSGENKSERILSPVELAKVEEVAVNKNNVIKRLKFGDNPIYAIQIASHENGLPQNTLAVIVKLQTEVESYTNKNDGITKYFTGSYSSYNQAVKAKNELVKKGFRDPFIIVIYKGKIISVKEYNNQKNN